MNRILKIIIAIFSGTAIIFLLAGLVVPEIEYTTTVTVDQPLRLTWDTYNDMDQTQKWIPEVKSYKILNETTDKVGTQTSVTIDNNGTEMTMIETTTIYEPEKRVGIRFEAGDMDKTDIISFTTDGGQTTLTAEHTCRGTTYLNRCLFAFFKSMFREIDQKYMDQFKEYIEKKN